MTRIHKTALVPYSAGEMFTLVEDINSYPKFLPWCKAAQVIASNESEVRASITMGSIGLNKAFTTRNYIQKNESIEMFLLNGPFSHLKGRWDFRSLGDKGCKVSLKMEFEISNHVLRVSLGPVFTHIVNSLVDAFIQRANELHGER